MITNQSCQKQDLYPRMFVCMFDIDCIVGRMANC